MINKDCDQKRIIYIGIENIEKQHYIGNILISMDISEITFSLTWIWRGWEGEKGREWGLGSSFLEDSTRRSNGLNT